MYILKPSVTIISKH